LAQQSGPGVAPYPVLSPPDPRGALGAEWLSSRRPPPPASSGLSVSVTTARRSLCPDSGSGTTEARPPASGVTPCAAWGVRVLVAPIAESRTGFSEQSSCCLAAP